MTDQPTASTPTWKLLLGATGILVFFGFLVLILAGYVGHEKPVERAARGDFDEETTRTRWDKLAEVRKAQQKQIDPAAVDSALEALAKAPPKSAKTDVVVPGSPTFQKQAKASGGKEGEGATQGGESKDGEKEDSQEEGGEEKGGEKGSGGKDAKQGAGKKNGKPSKSEEKAKQGDEKAKAKSQSGDSKGKSGETNQSKQGDKSKGEGGSKGKGGVEGRGRIEEPRQRRGRLEVGWGRRG